MWPWRMDVVCCEEKSVSRHVPFEAKCQETTRHNARLQSIMPITRFHASVSSHFRSFKDDVPKMES